MRLTSLSAGVLQLSALRFSNGHDSLISEFLNSSNTVAISDFLRINGIRRVRVKKKKTFKRIAR